MLRNNLEIKNFGFKLDLSQAQKLEVAFQKLFEAQTSYLTVLNVASNSMWNPVNLHVLFIGSSLGRKSLYKKKLSRLLKNSQNYFESESVF